MSGSTEMVWPYTLRKRIVNNEKPSPQTARAWWEKWWRNKRITTLQLPVHHNLGERFRSRPPSPRCCRRTLAVKTSGTWLIRRY